ncbi:RraA family protein [Methylobacterium sp. SyP6R]|uniref:RraA family protein n=1 Tax=Methylobacterium sp. SyP6R TaxID=2718876 RepID=UPI001F2255AE|nr:RraA family protein [Methylobacterium sp. SyP6R]MCF4130034.1 RraA family protein [Methylobacterium sp. SyP6R]
MPEPDMRNISNISAALSTCNLADAHDHLGLVCKWLSRDLTATRPARFWGYADVVQWGPTRKTSDIKAVSPSTWDEVKSFVAELRPSGHPRIYVSGCREASRDYVLLGGLSLTYLARLGYAGVVANGTIRDHDEVAELDLPIWSTGFAVMDSQGCMKVESRGTACTVAGHVVRQDDLVLGDGNGVVAVASEDIEAVLATATRIAGIESEMLAKIRSGGNLYDLVEGGGHI